MKKLFIHIGMGKTGTTSIQRTMYESSQILKRDKVYYPVKKRVFHGNHGILIYPLLVDRPIETVYFKKEGITTFAKANEKVKRLRNYWVTELKRFSESKCDLFVISAEKLQSLSINEIERLKEFVLPYFDEIQIIVYVRHFEGYVKSLLQEKIKNGVLSFENVNGLIRYDNLINYYFIDKWVNVFGKDNIIVRPFDRAHFINGNLIDDFMYYIGQGKINVKALIKETANTSIGMYSLQLLSEYNKKYRSMVNGELNPERPLNSAYTPPVPFFRVQDVKYDYEIGFSERDKKEFNEQIKYVNQYLKADEQFELIDLSKETPIPEAHNIPIDYYVELIKEYNKYIEELNFKIRELQNK